jgi:hypothetical protein
LLSDAAASTPKKPKKKKKKNSLFATNKKTGTYLNGSNNSNKCLQRLSIQIAKQHKQQETRIREGQKICCVASSFGSREGENENHHQSSPKPKKHVPNKLLQEREKSGDGVHNKRTFGCIHPIDGLF